MNVKCTFLNDILNEEVYVEQTLGFESFEFSTHVFKLHEALYRPIEAPRAWYMHLSKFFFKNGFTQD